MRHDWLKVVTILLVSLVPLTADGEGEDDWLELGAPSGLSPWKSPTGDWAVVAEVKPSEKDRKLLVAEPGEGVIYNGKLGRTRNLVSTKTFGDVEAHLEFLIPQGSNAGIKFEGLYEIQIFDSYGKPEPLTAMDCGGIYPRAQLLPRYHYLDDGHPPRTNACKSPGEWQILDVIFLAPRFDSEGKKIQNARFVSVKLNGVTVQDNQEAATPTGHAYTMPEVPTGPILLQADHGPVAFRSLKVRPYHP